MFAVSGISPIIKVMSRNLRRCGALAMRWRYAYFAIRVGCLSNYDFETSGLLGIIVVVHVTGWVLPGDAPDYVEHTELFAQVLSEQRYVVGARGVAWMLFQPDNKPGDFAPR